MKTVACFIKRFGSIALSLILILSIISFFMDGMKWSLIHIFLIVAFGGGIYYIIRSGLWEQKWFWRLIICVGIGARIAYVWKVHIPITSDSLTCLEAAQMFVDGDISWTKEPYFQRWAYQIPFVLYEALVIKIFGDISALYILNLLGSIVICVFIFNIVREITKDELTSLIVAALFVVMPSYIMHEGLLYMFAIYSE